MSETAGTVSVPVKSADSEIERAIVLADELRRKHNGIMGVRLFLGHDGHNACHLDDYDGEIGKGESGASLLKAVENAAADWRFWRLMRMEKEQWAFDVVNTAIEHAIASYQGTGVSSAWGTFNTSGLQQALKVENEGRMFTSDQIRDLMAAHPSVVRLYGGSHWFKLPDAMKKYEGGMDDGTRATRYGSGVDEWLK